MFLIVNIAKIDDCGHVGFAICVEQLYGYRRSRLKSGNGRGHHRKFYWLFQQQADPFLALILGILLNFSRRSVAHFLKNLNRRILLTVSK